MTLYYLPLLIRSDRYFVAKLDPDAQPSNRRETEFNFVASADDHVVTPLITLEDPGKLVLTQMAPSGLQDIPLDECRISFRNTGDGYEMLIEKSNAFSVESFYDEESGLRLDYSAVQKRVSLSFYRHRVSHSDLMIYVTLKAGEECYSAKFQFTIVPSYQCQRVVIDFGSEASQIAYRNGSPQSSIVPYDILENIISQLSRFDRNKILRREEFLNHEPGQPLLYRSFYAVRKNLTKEERENFPFNFSPNVMDDEIRLFITRGEIAATQHAFRDNYEIIPNLKLGIERSIQLVMESFTEDYSVRSHKKDLISAILLRLLRLMISTKPDFQKGGIIVTLLVPNIYTQHDVFELLDALRQHTGTMLQSLHIDPHELAVEYETISESDAAFMGYQQTNPAESSLANGEMALVIDCGKGTTDISILMADDNENYSSFFRTGFAGAGNVISYGFVEDFLTQTLRAIPGNNDISVKEFVSRHILDQNLTMEVLNFLQLIEYQKKRFSELQPLGTLQFAELTEPSLSTERKIATLYRDRSTLLQYAVAIMKDRNVRWDDELTGLIHKSTEAIVYCILSSIRGVLTKDIRKRIKRVMLSGRAFYFDSLREKLIAGLGKMLGDQVKVSTIAPGRSLNNKNIAIHGAFTGAYKITDFTGIPIDREEGLSRNNDVLNNNMFLYRGIKIQPGNDILYNTAVARRNNQQLKAFRNKTVDIFFTRDNIYLRLMEDQKVKDVRSLYTVLVSNTDIQAPVRDLVAISMFPSYTGELPSVLTIYQDVLRDQKQVEEKPAKKRSGILQLFQF